MIDSVMWLFHITKYWAGIAVFKPFWASRHFSTFPIVPPKVEWMSLLYGKSMHSAVEKLSKYFVMGQWEDNFLDLTGKSTCGADNGLFMLSLKNDTNLTGMARLITMHDIFNKARLFSMNRKK